MILSGSTSIDGAVGIFARSQGFFLIFFVTVRRNLPKTSSHQARNRTAQRSYMALAGLCRTQGAGGRRFNSLDIDRLRLGLGDLESFILKFDAAAN